MLLLLDADSGTMYLWICLTDKNNAAQDDFVGGSTERMVQGGDALSSCSRNDLGVWCGQDNTRTWGATRASCIVLTLEFIQLSLIHEDGVAKECQWKGYGPHAEKFLQTVFQLKP